MMVNYSSSWWLWSYIEWKRMVAYGQEFIIYRRGRVSNAQYTLYKHTATSKPLMKLIPQLVWRTVDCNSTCKRELLIGVEYDEATIYKEQNKVLILY